MKAYSVNNRVLSAAVKLSLAGGLISSLVAYADTVPSAKPADAAIAMWS